MFCCLSRSSSARSNRGRWEGCKPRLALAIRPQETRQVVEVFEPPRRDRAGVGRRHIGFRSLTEGLDTTNSGGKAIFPLFAAIASVERTLIQERTRAGLAAARQRGRIGGRPKLVTQEKLAAARRLLGAGTPPREVAGIFNISQRVEFLLEPLLRSKHALAGSAQRTADPTNARR